MFVLFLKLFFYFIFIDLINLSLLNPLTSLCPLHRSDRVDPARLRRQRRLGDVPLVRGPAAGHPRGAPQAEEVLRADLQVRGWA